jgi:hypothetical protein
MTATHETLARPASLGNAATAIFALLGLIDVRLAVLFTTPAGGPYAWAGSARRPSPRGPGSRASSAASGHMVMRGKAHSMIVSPNAHWCFADLIAVLCQVGTQVPALRQVI